MAALIVIARYLDRNDKQFKDYLAESHRHARAQGVSSADLNALRIIAGAIGLRL